MPTKLNVYAKNITSQHGEDGILEYIVSVLGARAIPVACEFGAWDGQQNSNTYRYWHDKNWKAVLIEGGSEKCAALAQNTTGKDVIAINRLVAVRGPDCLDEIFKAHGIGPQLGILSIDIDSFDYHVWKHMNYVDPQVVVIEHNQHIPPHIEYFDPEGEVYLKCSAKALEKLGEEKEYKLICCTKTNCIFVKNSLFDPSRFPDRPAEWLFDYSELKPQVIFTSEHSNAYPIFSKPARTGMKLWWRIYFRISALTKRTRSYRRPSPKVVRQIKAMGLDV